MLSMSSLSLLVETTAFPGIATLAYSSVSRDLQKFIAYFSFCCRTGCNEREGINSGIDRGGRVDRETLTLQEYLGIFSRKKQV